MCCKVGVGSPLLALYGFWHVKSYIFLETNVSASTFDVAEGRIKVRTRWMSLSLSGKQTNQRCCKEAAVKPQQTGYHVSCTSKSLF